MASQQLLNVQSMAASHHSFIQSQADIEGEGSNESLNKDPAGAERPLGRFKKSLFALVSGYATLQPWRRR